MKKLSILLIFIVFFNQSLFSKEKLDLELYDLMYKSFVYSKDLKNAYIVAKRVLKFYPYNLKWIKRTAQVSLWLGESNEAYKYYFYLYRKTKNPAIEKILFTFPYLEVFKLRIKKYEKEIKRHNYKNALELANLYEYEGYPEKSFKLMEYLYKKTKREDFFYAYIKYAIKLAKSEIVSRYPDKLKNLPLKKRYIVAYFLIAKGEYEKTLEIMRYVDKLPKEKEYYNILLFALLKSGHYNKFIKITKYLLQKDRVDISYIYPLLSYYYKKGDFETLEFIYSKMYEFNKRKDIIKGYIDILLHNKKYNKALKILNENQNTFTKKEYLITIAKVYSGLKQKKRVFKIYKILLGNYKEELTGNEKKEILWFLIDNTDKYYAILKKYLPEFEQDRDLYFAVINAYMKIQNLDKAEEIARKFLDKNKNNISFLLLYADILNIKSIFDESYLYYHKAWILANKKLKKNFKLLYKKEFLMNYIRLAYMFEDADQINRLLKIAKKVLNHNGYFDTKLDYFLHNNEFDPAFYMFNYRRIF